MALKLRHKDTTAGSPILDGLNEMQMEAVKAINGPALIIAGAGSGKTRVLTHRIAYLIENGVPPYNILALTFTNKSAREMQARLARLIPPEAASKIWAGTFHSVFARILRMEASEIGYTSSFSIYDTDDSLRVVKSILSKTGIAPKQYPPQGIRSRISWSKNKMIPWQEYRDSAETILEKQTSVVFEEYESILRQNNAMDFDDLLINMIRLLDKSRDILQKYQNRFKYILVDEYQDTNKSQYIAINQLSNAHQNICVVGDDAQSIYRWRGAEIQNILDFQKKYPYAKIIRLEQNYRSTKNILAAADSLIKNNSRQIPKNLWTNNSEGAKIKLIGCPDERVEAANIVSIVNIEMKGDYDIKDFAVLYRTNAQSLALENAFRQANLPYVIVGGMSFYKRKEVKDTIAYLRLLANPQDGESLKRVVNEPPRGFGKASMGHINNFSYDRSISLLDAFRAAEECEALQNRAKVAAMNFAAMIDKYVKLKDETKPAHLTLEFIEETGMLQMYKDIGTSDSMDRWNNIQQLLSDISMFFRQNKESTLEDYLQQISLVSEADEADTSKNKVTLMTLHAAKGLEFPVVIIAGVEQGLLPLTKAEQDQEEEEEERRLFYVGITRAEEKLYLSYARSRMKFGEISGRIPSRFLEEIDQSLLDRSGEDARQGKPARSGQPFVRSKFNDIPNQNISNRNIPNQLISNQDTHSQIPEEEFAFRRGNTVVHAKFGPGKITGLKGSGPHRQAVVVFNSVGKKTLMLKYANLKVTKK